MTTLEVAAHEVAEVTLGRGPFAADAAADAGAACLVRDPAGTVRRVPLFVAADGSCRARYASGLTGEHRLALDGAPLGLEGEWAIAVGPPAGDNPLRRHGPLVRPGDARHLSHADGTPFLWLADTWWYAFTGRLSDGDLAELIALRREQGFSAVQLVAGLYPEVEPFDALGDGETGWPWTDGFEAIDPAWWDAADRRIAAIAGAGLVPCVVGAWSYYLLHLGPERMRRHWREVVARWAAYPVVWCVAGEAGLPRYEDAFGPGSDRAVEELRRAWRAIAHEVRALDPFDRPLTVHPCPAFRHLSSRDVYDDADVLDLVMLQTGHADRQAIEPSLATLQHEVWRAPARPVVNAEVCYEGIAGGSWQDLQRFLAWTHLLSGAAGHTYGAHGLWAFRDAADPGPGAAWGAADWRTAAALPGAAQLGAARRVLAELRWHELVPRPEWVTPHWHHGCRTLPYAAGIPGALRVVYLPSAAFLPPSIGISVALADLALVDLEPGPWQARLVDPRSGEVVWRQEVEPDAAGTWRPDGGGLFSALPSFEDWVIVLERRGA